MECYYYPAFIRYKGKTYIIEKDEKGEDKYASVQAENGIYVKTEISCAELRKYGKKLN